MYFPLSLTFSPLSLPSQFYQHQVHEGQDSMYVAGEHGSIIQ